MKKVVITKTMIGICHMQVCAAKDASDEEILDACNSGNPAGTTNGWAIVHREAEPDYSFFKTPGPVQCQDFPDREHTLVGC